MRDAGPELAGRGPYQPLPHLSPSPPQASPKLSAQQEAERQALQSLRQGGALTGKFMSTSSIPGCLLGVTLEGDSSPHGHASLLQHVLLLEQARQQSTLIAGEWAGPTSGAQGRTIREKQSRIVSSPVTASLSGIIDFPHNLQPADAVLRDLCGRDGAHVPEPRCPGER